VRRAARSDSGSGLLVGGLAVALVVGAAVYFLTRDNFESENRPLLVELRHEAEMALAANQKKLAYDKYEQIVRIGKKHTLSDPALVHLVDDARTQMGIVFAAMEKDEEALANGKKAHTPQDLAARAEKYSKYMLKTARVLDAVQRAQADATGASADLARYKDDVKEIDTQYQKWYDEITAEEAAYPSAKMLKVATDALSTAGSWWQIQIDKKMPDALYADLMRRYQSELAQTALTRVKAAEDALDLVDEKPCGPCDGTGKLKCPVCRGSGICEFCKGKGDPVLKCCTNGVCNACLGRKEGDCTLCRGMGKYPPAVVKKAL
jgi:hypothetical protein